MPIIAVVGGEKLGMLITTVSAPECFAARRIILKSPALGKRSHVAGY